MRSLRFDDENMRVLHIIPHLGQGGAQTVLADLVSRKGPKVFHAVCTLITVESHPPVDIPVLSGSGGRRSSLRSLIRHVRDAVRRTRPDIVHGWMYHANLLTLGATGFGARILWSVHHGSPAAIHNPRTRIVSSACAALSRVVPDYIVYVAESARQSHEAAGYSRSRGVVVPNGVDLDRFMYSASPGRERDAKLTIGMVARYEPETKGHHFLIDVIASHPLRSEITLLFVGHGCDSSPALMSYIAERGLLAQTRVSGAIRDMPAFYNEIDLLVLPSFSEALPMAVLEAAAMGLPVCASRVGDVPRLGLPEETMFEPGDAEDCARALTATAAFVRRSDFANGQRRMVEERFTLKHMIQGYAEIYNDMLQRSGRGARNRLYRATKSEDSAAEK